MATPPEVTGPVNIGNPGEFTMIELAETVLALTGSRSPLERRPLPVDDPRRRKPDIAVARGQLGWEPRDPVETLADTIEDLRARGVVWPRA